MPYNYYSLIIIYFFTKFELGMKKGFDVFAAYVIAVIAVIAIIVVIAVIVMIVVIALIVVIAVIFVAAIIVVEITMEEMNFLYIYISTCLSILFYQFLRRIFLTLCLPP